MFHKDSISCLCYTVYMKRHRENFRFLFWLASEQKIHIIQLLISSLLSNFAYLLPPFAAAGIISVITEDQGNFSGIWFYILLYIVFYVAYFILTTWEFYAFRKLESFYFNNVQQKLFEHVVNNATIMNKISRGKITDTCGEDVRFLIDTINAEVNAITDIAQLVVIFGIFSYFNLWAAILTLLINLLYIYLMNRNAHRFAYYYEGTRKYRDKIIDIFTQMLNNVKQVKSLDIMPGLSKKLERSRRNWAIQSSGRTKTLSNRRCKLPLVVLFGKVFLYIFFAYLVSRGRMKISEFVLLIGYFEMVVKYTDGILEHLLNLSSYDVRIKRIRTILNYVDGGEMDYGEVENDYINGLVVFNNVYYQIGKKEVLRNVSFKAFPNEITIIVGKPGSGKTTIMSLLYRLSNVKSGSILIDDESIYNYSKSVYSSNVSGVFQKSFIFKMSIRENLGLIDNNFKNQMEACKRVGIHEEIEKLANGYNTIIDPEFNVLSDGLIQKLTIARALLSRAEILLFDEVTSNIDPESTTEIINIIKELKDDHTIIVTSHNPKVMEIADRVVVLKDGKVVAKGENKEVYDKSELYRNLKTAIFAQPSLPDEHI